MADTTNPQQQQFHGELSHAETQTTSNTYSKRGGWITFPFITAAVIGLTLASAGWLSNLIVYLIEEFNVKSVDAAQISNVVSGCTSLFPIAGAVLADSLFGCFSVITFSSIVSLLGILLLTLTATMHSLRPSSQGETPSRLQLGVLYSALTLGSIGVGGTRFTIATMGADQFDKPKDQGVFFNWFFFTLYVSSVINFTAIVYVEDNVGWGWGFGLATGANAVALAVFLTGKRYYRSVKPPKGSPFISLARVVVATIRKLKLEVPLMVSYSQTQSLQDSTSYYYGKTEVEKLTSSAPTPSFRFLNRAAIQTEGDTRPDGSIAKPWRLCTVDQVEDLKNLLRLFPLWSTGIFLNAPIGIQISLTVLQALTMDRHLGPHFQIPAGSFYVFALLSTSISISFIDRFLPTTWHKLTGRSPTPLQRIGLGHVLNIMAMAGSALVESRRLHVVRSHHLEDQTGPTVLPMSALWLALPLLIVGAGEALHFPGQVSLYYQEFPVPLRSTATAMIALIIGIGFYLSTAVIDLVRRITGWLPDNINRGRMDCVYWMLVVIGVANFGYYLTCARLYKYQNIDNSRSESHEDQE
ncbi:protein NRT1/ PTR FAMILY 2.7-like isoform X1 [Telopea speciosissima]|uniref:protein NRT1/ PTR FAMILY 2.7-like isoform X1 n=1 Tax=Telopea speciosissima TaxID=54955 RepID=UPI001CC6395C|nr:protein NRT1/ PTR FAMILY 2.7-like isoform X1 [Telopea speciosissima]